MFVKYPSLTNHYNVNPAYIDDLGMDVIVTEKLDGSNISICAEPDGTFRFASRNQFVANNWHQLDEIIPPYITAEILLGCKAAGAAINLFGEVFGDKVIKRLQYGKTRVRFYDLFIDGKPVPSYWKSILFEKSEFNNWFVTTHKTTLRKALEIDVEGYKSEFSEQFAEGIIIRPEQGIQFNSRVFGIKKKRQAFLEKAAKTKKFTSVDAEPLVVEFRTYLNENRVISVLSKHESVDVKMTGDLIKEVIEDAMTDFLLDHPLTEDEQKAVYKSSGNIVAPMILEKIRI